MWSLLQKNKKEIFYSSVIRVLKGAASRNQLLRFAVARPRKKDQKHEPVWNTDGHLPPACIPRFGARRCAWENIWELS